MPALQARAKAEGNSGESTQLARGRGRHPLGIDAAAWAPPKTDLIHGEWMLIGRHLGAISRCSQWWIGDWVRYGTARWGEKYSDAARATGYDPRSLANMASVAHAFPPSRRRDNLTWSHHATVVALERNDQDRWLDRAVAEGLSVADLRVELRTQKRLNEPSIYRKSQPAIVVVCPQCQTNIEVEHSVRPERRARV